ncbi:MAG: hypothetical protein FLDDKLPJ_02515 [Phycisphaerae bacterium]|nr:hypothetical protein [Phycisphaerae bacterium]
MKRGIGAGGLAALGGCAWWAGCAAPAAVNVMPVRLQKLSPASPLLHEYRPTACYAWGNDAGELCVAMTVRKRAFRTPFDQEEFHLSLVLGPPPAGEGRTYVVTEQTVRARTRDGLTHTRFASLEGVALAWKDGRGGLAGRFQFRGIEQSYLVVMGWTNTRQILCVGEFKARWDRGRGEPILRHTEKDGMARDQNPRSRPAPRPDEGETSSGRIPGSGVN